MALAHYKRSWVKLTRAFAPPSIHYSQFLIHNSLLSALLPAVNQTAYSLRIPSGILVQKLDSVHFCGHCHLQPELTDAVRTSQYSTEDLLWRSVLDSLESQVY